MQLDMRLNVKLAQKLVMTPQLQQAIKLLQLSKLELIQNIHQELMENPVLEEDLQEPAAEDKPSEAEPDENKEKTEGKEEEFDWQNYLNDTMGSGYSAYEPYNDSEETPSYENTLSKKSTLGEHLMWQLHMSSLDAASNIVGENIIGNLDGDGYLRATTEELVQATGATPEDVEKTLKQVQRFDPPGVAARDLQECLLIQVRQLDVENTVVEAM
ncbi:MAG: RNA polymerase sigma-54 factor, partial [bacterium]|nr:RNA polymerase sigma-54 factor [bacterium]